MGDSQQLSGPAAIIIGGLTIVCGAVPLVLMLRGDAGPRSPSDAPMWMGMAIALVFVCAGVAVIFDYAVGPGRTDDGQFLPGTPGYVRAVDTLIGLTIIGLMTAVFAWVAFGPGPRRFTTFVAIPFLATGWRSSELPGRVAFGVVAVMFALVFVGFGISALRRLRRAVRPTRHTETLRMG